MTVLFSAILIQIQTRRKQQILKHPLLKYDGQNNITVSIKKCSFSSEK